MTDWNTLTTSSWLSMDPEIWVGVSFEPLVAPVVHFDHVTKTDIVIHGDEATGGNTPLGYQWQRRGPGADWADLPEQTELNLTDQVGLAINTVYEYRLKVTDTLGNTAYSSTESVGLAFTGWGVTLQQIAQAVWSWKKRTLK